MSTTQPIKDRKELENFIAYYRKEKPHKRNYALVVVGLYTALRISDVLKLKWGDVYDFDRKVFRQHLYVKEKKTGKSSVIAVNPEVKKALESYKKERNPKAEDYIFTKTTDYSKPLSRSQAYRIVKRTAENVVEDPHISCHSLRKTFGYYAWKLGTPPAMLMEVYNHSTYGITRRYLGISQDERDSVYMRKWF